MLCSSTTEQPTANQNRGPLWSRQRSTGDRMMYKSIILVVNRLFEKMTPNGGYMVAGTKTEVIPQAWRHRHTAGEKKPHSAHDQERSVSPPLPAEPGVFAAPPSEEGLHTIPAAIPTKTINTGNSFHSPAPCCCGSGSSRGGTLLALLPLLLADRDRFPAF